MTVLTGKRILLVEDEFIVTIMISEMLEELGATVVGPAATIAKACSLASIEKIDAAVLDVNIDGVICHEVAQILFQRKIPFIFETGYGARGIPGEYADKPILRKPFQIGALEQVLSAEIIRAEGESEEPPH